MEGHQKGHSGGSPLPEVQQQRTVRARVPRVPQGQGDEREAVVPRAAARVQVHHPQELGHVPGEPEPPARDRGHPAQRQALPGAEPHACRALADDPGLPGGSAQARTAAAADGQRVVPAEVSVSCSNSPIYTFIL
uniref:(northern house mosquito) hypothetical protein n=1 Tax=Culex pipiens TaxID=7175 RepID=A0A8D8AME3_CULPI